MSKMTSLMQCVLLVVGMSGWQVGRATEGGDRLCEVMVVSRHGVRSPTTPLSEIAPFSDQAWPRWPVAPGLLTPHGRILMVLMGRYYSARFRAEGLWDGQPAAQAEAIYACSDDAQRTIASAEALAEGVLGRPGLHVEVLPHNYGEVSPKSPYGNSGGSAPALTIAAVRSRYSDDLPGLVRAYQRQFETLGAILGRPTEWMHDAGPSGPGVPRGKVTGPLSLASNLVEDLVLEYAEGIPAVGWGRMTREQLADCYILHALQFDFTERTLTAAQAGSSVLANRIICSLDQATSGQAVSGAFGPLGTKLVIVGTHDGNLANLAGLLGVSWIADGLGNSPTLPGGALVLELWRHGDGSSGVRGYYMAQTLDQMRAAQPLDLSTPPAVATLMLPGGTSGQDNEAPLNRFESQWRKVLDARQAAR